MKKFLLGFCILFLLTGNAYADHGNRLGAQFSSGGNIGLIYYGDDFEWAAGGSIGFAEEHNDVDDDIDTDVMDWDTDSLEFSIFARKNYKVREATYIGLGISATFASGETVKAGYSGVDYDSHSISPYFIIDYHLSKHIILNAGADLVTFKHTEYEMNIDNQDIDVGESDSIEYMSPFLSLTYLF